MRSVFCILAVIALAVADDVLDLSDNFEDEIDNHDLILVEFFAPWCGHCKRLAPEFETAANALLKNDPPVALAKVDCTADGGKDVCSKHGVSGYPTLKIFRNGEFAEDYSGPRESAGIVSFMKSKSGPSFRVLESVKDIEKFLETDQYAAVAFLTDLESETANVYKKAADSLTMEMKFGLTSDKKSLEKYKYKDEIVLFQPKIYQSKFEEAQQKYDGKVTSSKLKSFLSDAIIGLCGERTTDNSENFKKPLVTVYFDVDYKLNPKGTNYWRNRAMKVGKKFVEAGKTIYFSIANSNTFGREIEEFGLKAADIPVVSITDTKGQKFPMSGKLSVDSLESFITDFFEDNLTPYLKSEDIPEPNDEPVKVVVAKNFDEIVNDPDRDVLIEFYAPWCGHCKTLAPKFDELGEKLKNEPGVTIAKMDATANDVPKNYEVRGFPTIYYAPRGSKETPQTYQGGREVDEFLKFLAKEATDEMQEFNRSGKAKKGKKKTEL